MTMDSRRTVLNNSTVYRIRVVAIDPRTDIARTIVRTSSVNPVLALSYGIGDALALGLEIVSTFYIC